MNTKTKATPPLDKRLVRAMTNHSKKAIKEILAQTSSDERTITETPIEELLSDLVRSCKTDRKQLARLKNVAVHCQQYALAVKLRDIEKKHFPQSKEEKDAKHIGNKLNLLFRMVDLAVPESTAWLIQEALKLSNKKKGNFDLRDASTLLEKKAKLFFDEKL